MSLEAKAVRAEVCRILRGRTIAEDRVWRNRATPIQQNAGPQLVVHTRQMRPPRKISDAPTTYEVDLSLAIEGFVFGQDLLPNDDLADDLHDQVLSALLPNLLLPRIRDAVYVHPQLSGWEGTEWDFEADSEREVGAFQARFRFVFHLEVDALDGEQNRERVAVLRSLGVSYDVAPPDGAPEASDDIDPGAS